VGANVRVVTRPEEIGDARALVLPGVGAFDDCINALRKQELIEASLRFVKTGRPFLGICVGYQALFEKSEEFNSCAAGLCLFGGRVVRFRGSDGLKVPQIGWNQIEIQKSDCPILKGINSGSYVYFVHSFYPEVQDPGIVATETVYGQRFASAVWKDNVYATQFHPEKSQRVGLQLLSNFTKLAA
jgi:imidazole glycerol-phosphate synthase subunit HisH